MERMTLYDGLSIAVRLIEIVVVLALPFLYVWSIAWAIGDAQKRGHAGCLPICLFVCLGPFAIVGWLLLRPGKRVADKQFEDYEDADDALSAAHRLEMLGDWDAAIALYRHCAERYPEHKLYVEQCIEQIKEKQSRM